MPDAPTYRNALPLQAMLLEYRLESVLGAGGFGMTYLGWDTHLEKHVAIKEYLPGELAIRALDGSVVPVNTEHEYDYQWGLDRFIQEARTLARFSHANIVRVNRYFEANGTGYMVMDYEAGESLNQYLRRVPLPDEAALKKMLLPILDGLQAVHQAGFLHRDIKPSNVFIRANGVPVLLDFGSARMATGNASKSLTAIVSPGYAPLEQYSSTGNQGPWSDIYALAGVTFRAVSGENPPDAVSRMKSDSAPLTLAAARPRYNERFLKAIEWGMMLDERMRPQNIAEWRELFLGRAPLTAVSRGTAALNPGQSATTVRAPVAKPATVDAAPRAAAAALSRRPAAAAQKDAPGMFRWLILGGGLLIVVLVGATWMKRQHRQEPAPAPPASARQTEMRAALPVREQVDAASSESSRVPVDAANSEPSRVPVDAANSEPSHAPAPHLPEMQAGKRADTPPLLDAAGREPPPPRGMRDDNQPEAGPRDTVRQQSMREPQAAAGADMPPPLRKAFMAADRDGDRYLSRDEVRGHFPAIDRNFAAVDSNHDERISLDELWQFRRKQPASKPQLPR